MEINLCSGVDRLGRRPPKWISRGYYQFSGDLIQFQGFAARLGRISNRIHCSARLSFGPGANTNDKVKAMVYLGRLF